MRGTGTVELGIVHAVDEAAAVRKAVEQFDIAPALQNRIMVRPWY